MQRVERWRRHLLAICRLSLRWRFDTQVVLGCVALLVLIWTVLLKDMQELIARDEKDEQRQIENVAEIGAKALLAAVHSVDRLLLDLRNEWRNDPDQFAAIVQRERGEVVFDFDFDINLINATGQLQFSTLNPSAVGMDLSDRPNFVALRESGQDRLVLNPPHAAKFLDRQLVNFSRPLLTADGQFAGLVSFSVKPDYLSNLYKTLDLGHNGIMAVRRDDGVVLMRIPELTGVNAGNVQGLTNQPPNGFARIRSPLDQVERMTAWRKTPGYPLTLLVGRPALSFEREVQAHRLRYLASGALISLLLLLALYWLLKNVHSRERTARQRAVELDRLTQTQRQLAASQLELRQLAAHQTELQELEHKRIAQEIHDELGQRLTVLRMDLAMLPRTVQADPAGLLPAQVNVIKGNIDAILAIVRDVVGMLRPPTLDVGLAAAAESLLAEFQISMGIPCRLNNLLPPELVLSEARATGIFRILQEALTNAARHAKASRIEVTLALRDAHLLLLKVSDNGLGFKLPDADAEPSFGLSGMRERAIALGGILSITAKPSEGTTVQLIIPVPNSLRARQSNE